jgi:hypothetical protein
VDILGVTAIYGSVYELQIPTHFVSSKEKLELLKGIPPN